MKAHRTKSPIGIHCNACQNPAAIFVEIDNLILKFIWKCKGLKNIQYNLERSKLEDSHFLISKFTTM